MRKSRLARFSEKTVSQKGTWRMGACAEPYVVDGECLALIKRSREEEIPQPHLYTTADLQLRKAEERLRGPCGLPKPDHNDALFRLPPSADKEVKKLPFWDAGRMKKQLAGKAAPELVMTDMQGKTIKLSGLRGKTVLLDFWATWCGPCRADGPSLDKLYRKYGDRNLTIIGISVNEERSIVQKFIAEHPHSYPIALTTENEMPRPYQVGVFPTYMVIDSEGKLAFATEGEKGFSELRKLLKKAGLDTE